MGLGVSACKEIDGLIITIEDGLIITLRIITIETLDIFINDVYTTWISI